MDDVAQVLEILIRAVFLVYLIVIIPLLFRHLRDGY